MTAKSRDTGYTDLSRREVGEEAALLLVGFDEYVFWESQVGWCTGGIAAALELPRWAIEAYRRVLEREAVDVC